MVIAALVVSLTSGTVAAARPLALEDLVIAFDREEGGTRFPVAVVDHMGFVFEDTRKRVTLASPCRESLEIDYDAKTLACHVKTGASGPVPTRVVFARFDRARPPKLETDGPGHYTFLEFDKAHAGLASYPNYETQEFDHVLNVY